MLAHSEWTIGADTNVRWLYDDLILADSDSARIVSDHAFYLLDVGRMTNEQIRGLEVSATVRTFLFVLRNAMDTE